MIFDTDSITRIVNRTGRYSLAETGRGTTKESGVDIQQAPSSYFDRMLRDDTSLSIESQDARIRNEMKKRDLKNIELKKQNLLGEISAIETTIKKKYQISMLGGVGGASTADTIAELDTIKGDMQSFREIRNAISSAESLEAMDNVTLENGQVINTRGFIQSQSNRINNVQPKQIESTPSITSETTAPAIIPSATTSPTRSRVLNKIKGKQAPVAPQDNVLGDVVTEAEKVGDTNRHIQQLSLSGSKQVTDVPNWIHDQKTVDAINAAKTPAEKQQIIDMYAKTKVQEAGDTSKEFTKEADTNKDGVISGEEAGAFMTSHEGGYQNVAEAKDKQTVKDVAEDMSAVKGKEYDIGQRITPSDIASGSKTGSGYMEKVKFLDNGNAIFGYTDEKGIWNQTGGITADQLKFDPRTKDLPEVQAAVSKANEERKQLQEKTSQKYFQPDREKILKELAQEGFDINESTSYDKSGKTIHGKYSTVLSNEEKQFIQNEQYKIQDDSVLKTLNQSILKFDSAKTKAERDVAKKEAKGYLANLKKQNPQQWKRVKATVTEQWDKINKPDIAVEKFNKIEKEKSSITNKPEGAVIKNSGTDNTLPVQIDKANTPEANANANTQKKGFEENPISNK